MTVRADPLYYRTDDALDAETTCMSRRRMKAWKGPWHVWRVEWNHGEVEYVVTRGLSGEADGSFFRERLADDIGVRRIL